MIVTYCDGCGVLVHHPKAEVRVHCPACFKRREAMATRVVPALPYAERMNDSANGVALTLVRETARHSRS